MTHLGQDQSKGALGAARVTAAVTLGGGVRRRGMCVLRQCRKKGCKKGSRSKREVRATGTRGCAGLSGRGQAAAWAGGTRVLGRGWKLGLGCYGFPPPFFIS